MDSNINVFRPPVLGWLEKKLSDQEVLYLWDCISKSGEEHSSNLAGNIQGSYLLNDKDDWFFQNTLSPLCERYSEEFDNLGNRYQFDNWYPYSLQKMLVNFQNQGEFNPVHDHGGIYSFVIWMQIPTEFEEQNEIHFAKKSNSPRVSAFEFSYMDILGVPCGQVYQLGKKFEGVMLFFPAKLQHQVYPFFNCNEQRISISGNIGFGF